MSAKSRVRNLIRPVGRRFLDAVANRVHSRLVVDAAHQSAPPDSSDSAPQPAPRPTPIIACPDCAVRTEIDIRRCEARTNTYAYPGMRPLIR